MPGTSIEASPVVYLIAGEQSGDVLGARLMGALRQLRPGVTFAGIGGPRMAAEGLVTLFPMHEIAVMGLVEILPRIHRLSRLLSSAIADVIRVGPSVLVTIDSPGFTLRLLRRIRSQKFPRVHYVAPQVWAWREHRVSEFPGLWDRLLCLFPFEVEFFARHNLPATFVGHPVIESGAGSGDGARFRAAYGLSAEQPLIILMPGSRRTEVGRLLPIYSNALKLLTVQIPGLRAVIPAASAVAATVQRATDKWVVPPLIVTNIGEKHDAYAAAAAALTKSGTSTLELALAGVPMAVTYRVNPVTAFIARRLIRVPYVAMVNILAEREIVPELLQQDCTAELLASTLYRLISSQDMADAQRSAFRRVVAKLTSPSGTPANAAAIEILGIIDAAAA